MFSLIDKLRASRKKNVAEIRSQMREIKQIVTGRTPEKQQASEAATNLPVQETEKSSETSQAQGHAQTTASDQAIVSNQEYKQKTPVVNARRAEIKKAAQAKQDLWKKKYNQLDRGKIKVLNLVFMAIAAAIAVLLIGFDIWPATFFKELEFQKNLARRDMFVGIETSILLYLLLFPVQYYFLRRMVNRVELKEPEQFDEDPDDDGNGQN